MVYIHCAEPESEGRGGPDRRGPNGALCSSWTLAVSRLETQPISEEMVSMLPYPRSSELNTTSLHILEDFSPEMLNIKISNVHETNDGVMDSEPDTGT
jgi:hypothetical protein